MEKTQPAVGASLLITWNEPSSRHPILPSLAYLVKFNTNTSLSALCDPVTQNNSYISSRHKDQNAIREGVAGPSTTRREVLGSRSFIAPLEQQQQKLDALHTTENK